MPVRIIDLFCPVLLLCYLLYKKKELIRVIHADPYRSTGTTYLHGPHLENKELESTNQSGAVVFPISLATTFRQSAPGEATGVNDPNSFGLGYEYSRTGNPTRGEFERAMAAAEKAKYCVAFSSGSAATSSVVHLLAHGESIICVDVSC
jgi:cystathionine gamma-lyase